MKRWIAALTLGIVLGWMGQAWPEKKRPDDSPFALLGNIFSLPFQITYKLFSPLDVEDLSTAYRRAGFSRKDQDYFQLNWYGEQRLGYSNLFERKELEEEISREGFQDFRDR